MGTTKDNKSSLINVVNLAAQRRVRLKEQVARSLPSNYHVFNQASDLSDLKVVIVNGTLKRQQNQSNTVALTECVIREFAQYSITDVTHFHLAQMDITIGIEEVPDDPNDKMRVIYDSIKQADIFLVATPIWWGGPSSLIQKIIERLDIFDEFFLKEGTSLLYGKTFGAIIVGAEDGVQQVYGQLTSWASFLGFTIAPMGVTYWIGEGGRDKKHITAQEIVSSSSTQEMTQTMVMNCINTAYILKQAMAEQPSNNSR